jgi:hypothetical protein
MVHAASIFWVSHLEYKGSRVLWNIDNNIPYITTTRKAIISMIFKIFKGIVSHEIGRACRTNGGKGKA